MAGMVWASHAVGRTAALLRLPARLGRPDERAHELPVDLWRECVDVDPLAGQKLPGVLDMVDPSRLDATTSTELSGSRTFSISPLSKELDVVDAGLALVVAGRRTRTSSSFLRERRRRGMPSSVPISLTTIPSGCADSGRRTMRSRGSVPMAARCRQRRVFCDRGHSPAHPDRRGGRDRGAAQARRRGAAPPSASRADRAYRPTSVNATAELSDKAAGDVANV
jgi:hypothetical protein